jgi:hypothetical protein
VYVSLPYFYHNSGPFSTAAPALAPLPAALMAGAGICIFVRMIIQFNPQV